MSEQQEFWEEGGRYRSNQHPVVELFARQRIAYLESNQALHQVANLLDVGAGSGFSSMYYPPHIRVTACDYAGGMLDTNPAPDRIRSLADRLPFATGSFDAVACWELLHHLPDPTAALSEMWRVARRRVIIFEPNRIHPGHIVLGLTREEERASLRFTPGHLRRLVQAGCGRSGRQLRCGLLFPNITPLPIARAMMHLPFRMPVIGISQLMVVEKE